MRAFGTMLRCGVAACVVLGAVPVFAQEAPATADGAAVAQSSQPEGVGDIIVTAERRSENLQRVPVSVGVVSGADLRAF